MNDLFKFGEFFLNYFLGKKNFIGEKSLEISAEILNQLRRILILVVMTIGSLALFCMGMSYLIERFLNNLDNGQALFTPSIWFILGFLVVCIGVMIYATRKQNWLDIFKSEKKEVVTSSPVGGNAIESVLSLLILDFIKERELKREQEKIRVNESREKNE
jgi:uncharacterized membrane protein YidH (DUF202 family)